MFNTNYLTALGLTLSSCCFAGTMGAQCLPSHSTLPCAIQQWDLGLQALALKPIHTANRATLTNTADQYKTLNTPWGWGFRLDGSYHFNTGHDLNLDWTHYDASSHLDPLTLNTTNRFDQVNMVLGQAVHFSPSQSARFYSGLQYARIHTEQLRNNAAIPSQEFIPQQQTMMDFNGLGPVVGINLAYAIGSGFSITANTATSILYGSNRANLAKMDDSALLVSSSFSANSRSVVPSIEEKLGLNYQHEFSQGLLTLDGGYQALNYFNPLTQMATAGIVNSDFGLYGPYFGAHWLGLSLFS